ncbi:unnamed protein product [Spirodela intermedia]|uniref:Uncharacterized protein n=1 Tax=Spirodela intermedia TaxID=51605 RepID=A0A7I8LI66_SPIIN|nr:unnamed protein product [Spirodela intermedia]
MAAITSPCAATSSSFSSSSSSAAAALNFAAFPPHPPRKPLQKQKHHHALFSVPTADGEMARARRSPSPPMRPPPGPDRGDSDTEGSCYADENRFEPAQGHRISETPCPSGIQRGKAAVSQSRRVVRLFRENGGEQDPQLRLPDSPKVPDALPSRAVGSKFLARKPRPGTPMVHPLERNAATSVTPRPTPDGQNQARSLSGRTGSRRSSTQVNRSLQETLKGAGQRWPGTPSSEYEANGSRSGNTSPENSTTTEFSETEICSISSPGGMGICDSPPIHGQSSRSRLSSECRSSMPEADLLPTMATRVSTEGKYSHADSSSYRGISSSLCHRSLNSALSSCQPRQIHPTSSVCKLAASPKDHSGIARAETAIGKMGLDSRKGRKMSSRQEDSHTLRLLENCYLQWRFVNAKAQAAMEAREIVAERSLHALSTNLLELRDSVTTKHIELNEQRRMSNVSTIVQAQMPHLSEWASLEDECSGSLSGAAKSLQDASLRLPVSGNVKVDMKEIGVTLHSATDVLESLASRVKCFLPKADGMQNVASDLAKVVCEERALIEECGDFLAGVQELQVKECSLRAHLIQLRRTK